MKSQDVASIRRKLNASLDEHVQRAAGVVSGREETRLPEDQYKVFRSSAQGIQDALDLDAALAKLEARNTHVVREPRVYERGSDHSYYADRIKIGVGNPSTHGYGDAQRRMGRYAQELTYEIEHGSVEGRRAERILRDATRTPNEGEHRRRYTAMLTELRTLETGGGATATAPSEGAAFVSPAFLLDDWAPYRGIYRSFADQCCSRPLPAFGMQVYLPAFTSTSGVTEQTEGAAVNESVPSTAFQGAEVKSVAGRITLTQQMTDRAFAGGHSFDAEIELQLHEQLDEKIDKYVLGQAITNGEPVAGAASFSIAEFFKDVAKGREKLTDTAGTRLKPVYMFTTSDLYSFVTRQVHEEKPLMELRYWAGFPTQAAADDFDSGEAPQWSRFTSTVMPGGVLWMTDDNIPVVGTTTKTQLLVTAPSVGIILMESEPLAQITPETSANELKVVVTYRSYVAAITRHTASTAVITGAAYTTAEK